METNVRKWGHSLAIRIPRPYAEELGIAEGDAVHVAVENGRLVVRPKPHSLSLGELLKRVRPGSLHDEVESGPAVGGEAW
jgi:antitoxin MazE